MKYLKRIFFKVLTHILIRESWNRIKDLPWDRIKVWLSEYL